MFGTSFGTSLRRFVKGETNLLTLVLVVTVLEKTQLDRSYLTLFCFLLHRLWRNLSGLLEWFMFLFRPA